MADITVTVKIAGLTYHLKADSPEKEQVMRLAAKDVDNLLSRYEEKFSGTSFEDKLAFVALNEAMGKLQEQQRLRSLKQEIEILSSQTHGYLEGKK